MINMKWILAVIAAALLLSSCGDSSEDVAGCTDSRAENYNPNATSNNNSCVYPNEKFFAKYIGDFACGAPLSSIQEMGIEFELAPPANADDVDKVTLSTTVTGIPISLEGTVDGNTVEFLEKKVENVSFMGLSVDVVFSGTATLSGDDISADLSISASLLSGNCTFTGKKQ